MPKLSIITINRNNASGLVKTIESVFAQTWRDFEYIIIDGASTDDSVNVIRSYESINKSSQNPIQIKWVSEPDAGIYNAMNKGTLLANGEYCLYLNSGDFLYESTTLLHVFRDNAPADFIFGRVAIPDENGKLHLAGRDNTHFTPFQLFQSAPPHQGSFMKRSLILKVGMYDEQYKLVADFKCIYQCLMIERATVAYVNKIISVMEANGISYQRHEECLVEDDRIMVELYSEEFREDFHELLELQKENMELKSKINTYRSAILFYDKIKKYNVLRKVFNYIAQK